MENEVKRNLIIDYYDHFPSLIKRCVDTIAPILDETQFSPGFRLPELDGKLIEFFSVAKARWLELETYKTHKITLMDLRDNPKTQTTKTFASLIMIARAIQYIRNTKEKIIIIAPTSGNKGIALRDAVERAVVLGLIDPTELRVITLVPEQSKSKLRRSLLSSDKELRKLNPIFVYQGQNADNVKLIAANLNSFYLKQLRDANDGAQIWYSLNLQNYKIADAARAFLENDVSPTSKCAPRTHVHAVSSAFGLLGYNLGRDVIEAEGSSPSTRPSFLLVQHLGTPDMVLNLLHGSFERKQIPTYIYDNLTRLHSQTEDPHFPETTIDPDEILDTTFYTHIPKTSGEMNSIIERSGGTGIVVSMYECLGRYNFIRNLLRDTEICIPADPRTVLEWSLIMAFTGAMNAADRSLLSTNSDLVIHGSGFYTKEDIDPIEADALNYISCVEDVAKRLLADI